MLPHFHSFLHYISFLSDLPLSSLDCHCIIHTQTLTDLMDASEIEEMNGVDEQRQKESKEEKKRRKLAEDMEKEHKERVKKKQELLRKEKEVEKVYYRVQYSIVSFNILQYTCTSLSLHASSLDFFLCRRFVRRCWLRSESRRGQGRHMGQHVQQRGKARLPSSPGFQLQSPSPCQPVYL